MDMSEILPPLSRSRGGKGGRNGTRIKTDQHGSEKNSSRKPCSPVSHSSSDPFLSVFIRVPFFFLIPFYPCPIVEMLPVDDQLLLVEIIKQRLIQHRRTEIIATVAEARESYQKENVRRGTAEDLLQELEDFDE
jgi:hypothetical protein